MTELRIFVNESGTASFLCPQCGSENPVTPSDEEGGLVETDVSCSCGYRDRALVDKRRAPRITVGLSGEMVRADDNPRSIRVRALSRLGLGFEAPDNVTINIGDEVAVELFLEDVGAAVIRKKAIVRNLSGRFFGAEFIINQPPNTYDKICDRALAVYLQGGDPDGY